MSLWECFLLMWMLVLWAAWILGFITCFVAPIGIFWDQLVNYGNATTGELVRFACLFFFGTPIMLWLIQFLVSWSGNTLEAIF